VRNIVRLSEDRILFQCAKHLFLAYFLSVEKTVKYFIFL
jgi:hypothetical protein